MIKRKKFKKILFALIVCLVNILIIGCGKAVYSETGINRSDEFITVATGPSSGLYFPIGGAFAEALKKSGYHTSVQATGGSAENISMISKGEAELAIAMQDSVVQAYEGFGAYEGKKRDNLRAMMRLWPNYVQIVTLKNSNINSVEDLKGKRVGVGASNSGVELNARMIYESFGMTYSDSKVDYLSYSEAIDQMKNGQIDAAFVTSGIPNGTIMELSTSYDMKIVPITGKGREALINKYPFFSEATIPANTYNNKEDIETVFVYNIMLVSDKLSDEIVYDMMSVIFENIEIVKSSHNAAKKNIDLSYGVEDIKIPLHSGAEKFWREKGFKIPNN